MALTTSNTIDAFTDGVVRVLSSAELRERLKAGCRESASHYTLQNMVRNFQGGVHGALETS